MTSTAIFSRRLAFSLAAMTVLLSTEANCQQRWRYQLRAGDHLVYSESFEKETIGPETHYSVKATFKNHILVLDETRGIVTVAIQRNRESADLLKANTGKKPPSEDDLKKFAERLAGYPDRIADTNQLEVSGGLRYAPAPLREWSSRTLIGFEEFPLITPVQPNAGDKWRTSGYFGADYTVLQNELLDGEPCILIEGTALAGHIRLRYWISQSSHNVVRATYHSEYGVSSGNTREDLTLRLVDIKHDQTLDTWLGSPDTRVAALTGLEQFPSLATLKQELQSILGSDDAEAATIALSVAARRKIPLDPASLNNAKLTPEGDRIRALLSSGKTFVPPPFAPGITLQIVPGPEGSYTPFILKLPRYSTLDDPAPLVVYLAGGPGVALDALSGSTLRNSEFAALYPNAIGMWWDDASIASIDYVLTKLHTDLRVPAKNTFIAGFSNGGGGAELYASRWPERFGGAVALMGAGECDGLIKGVSADQLAKVPLLLVHGRQDKIIPYECSQELFRKLQKKKANVRLELLDKGHEITLDSDGGLGLEFLRKVFAEQKTETVTSNKN